MSTNLRHVNSRARPRPDSPAHQRLVDQHIQKHAVTYPMRYRADEVPDREACLEDPPDYPVLWASTTPLKRTKKVPFGEMVEVIC